MGVGTLCAGDGARWIGISLGRSSTLGSSVCFGGSENKKKERIFKAKFCVGVQY